MMEVIQGRDLQRKREAEYRARLMADPVRLEAKRQTNRAWRQRNPEKKRVYSLNRIASYKRRKPWVFTVIAAKRRAKKYGMEFELTSEWAERLYPLGSALSGLPFGRGAYAASIDRIDSDIGYTVENSRLILHAENLFKNKWSDDVVIDIARAIAGKAQNVP